MIARVWIVYTVEFVRAIRLKQTFLGPALVLAAVLLAPLIHPIARDGLGDYTFIAYVTPMALSNLGFLLMLVYSAGLIAPELASGAIRQTLVRPVRRQDYFLAKLLLGMTHALLLSIVAACGSWALVYAFGEADGVFHGGELVYTHHDMCTAYALGSLLGLAPQWAGVGCALMISVMTQRAVAAISAAAGLWVLVNIAKYPLGIERYVFSTYLESPWQVFADRCDNIESAWMPMAGHCLATSSITLAVSTLCGIYVLHRRNLS